MSGQTFDAEAFKRKIDAAKAAGEVVSSIDDLVCPVHPGAKFKEQGRIPGSYVIQGAKVYVYICSSCSYEGSESPTRAYDCMSCGCIVKGEMVKQPASGKNVPPYLQGREGTDYFCTVCGSQTGEFYKIE